MLVAFGDSKSSAGSALGGASVAGYPRTIISDFPSSTLPRFKLLLHPSHAFPYLAYSYWQKYVPPYIEIVIGGCEASKGDSFSRIDD
jgi:hypothetical protein